MNEFFMMFSIFDRDKMSAVLKFLSENKINSPSFISLSYGTAEADRLANLGLTSSEKAFSITAITQENWKIIKKGFFTFFNIDNPGTGISFIVPLSSIGDKQQLLYLLNGQEINFSEESTLKDTTNELIIAISRIGFSELVMEAARRGGATGGTILHAKGTGTTDSEKFFGITLTSEKEIILIVASKEKKNSIMSSIISEAGLGTKAQSIVFSLPVTDTAGLKMPEAFES